MSTRNDPTPFNWGKISLSEVIYIDNVPHTTRRAIGEWLEYDDPVRAMDKVLRRNNHVDKHSTVVNLTTVDRKNRSVSVYHPIGFLLIVMESGQPKAQRMKEAVAEFVWHFAGPRRLKPRDELALAKFQHRLVVDVAKAKDAFSRQVLGERLSRVCLTLGQPMPPLTHLDQEASQLKLEGV